MKQIHPRKLLSFVSFRAFLALGALGAATAAVVACSASLTTGSGAACSALSSCCSSIGGAEGTACQEDESAAASEPAGDGANACQALLQSYQSSGYCGGGDGGVFALDSGGTTVVWDGSAASVCVLTGTCDAGNGGSGGGSSGGSSGGGPGTQCQLLGSCNNGETYGTCVTNSGDECTASVVFSNGQQIACASCTDCAAATSEAAALCTTTSGEDAGTNSAPDCGSPPTIHSELEAGAYCPFTPTGSVHCAAGQECCEPTTGDQSSCQAAGATCPIAGSLTWHCTDPLDCQGSSAGAVCCATGTLTYDSTCGFDRGTSFTGSECATSCGTGQIEICSTVSDPCSALGTTCTPFKVAGLVLGACQ